MTNSSLMCHYLKLASLLTISTVIEFHIAVAQDPTTVLDPNGTSGTMPMIDTSSSPVTDSLTTAQVGEPGTTVDNLATADSISAAPPPDIQPMFPATEPSDTTVARPPGSMAEEPKVDPSTAKPTVTIIVNAPESKPPVYIAWRGRLDAGNKDLSGTLKYTVVRIDAEDGKNPVTLAMHSSDTMVVDRPAPGKKYLYTVVATTPSGATASDTMILTIK